MGVTFTPPSLSPRPLVKNVQDSQRLALAVAGVIMMSLLLGLMLPTRGYRFMSQRRSSKKNTEDGVQSQGLQAKWSGQSGSGHYKAEG